MSKRFTQLLFSLLALPLVFGTAQASQERLLRDSDLKKLGGALADYFEAMAESKGIDKAQAELDESIAKVEKKLKGKSLLSAPADFGRAYHMSRNYSKAKVKKGKVTDAAYPHPKASGGEVAYSYWLPKKYNASKQTYPLILLIPDEDESTANHIKEQWLSSEIRDNAILLCVSMPGNRNKWLENMVDGELGGIGHFFMGFRAAQENFAVDFDRIFVAGRGAGVPAAVAVGNFFPYRFAGIIGRSGDAGTIGPDNYSNLPTFFAGAGKNATSFQEKAKEAGFENVTIEPGGKEADIWNWMTSNPRRTYPEELTLVPGNVEGKPYPTRAYWLGVRPSEGRASLKGRVDKAKNTIYVDGEGVSDVTLYLNDAIVDLDKPVKVICNGVENEASFPRRLSVTLDFLKRSTSDASCVYVATNSFPLPAPSDKGSE